MHSYIKEPKMLEALLSACKKEAFKKTTMLLHMDSTSPKIMIDEVGNPCSFLKPTSNILKIATDVKKFGYGSLAKDGVIEINHVLINNDSILPDNLDDFTIEFHHYWSSAASGYPYNLLECGNFRLVHNPGAGVFGVLGDNGLNLSHYGLTSKIWNHVAVVRRSGVFYIYQNGILKLTKAHSGTIAKNPIKLFGSSTANSSYSYYARLDEVRISNVARYTAAFTVPNTPFELD